MKFHLDEVSRLGSLVEIEAIDTTGEMGKIKLLDQCNFYRNVYGIKDENRIDVSYSDLLIGASRAQK